jgi:hypothetical protein
VVEHGEAEGLDGRRGGGIVRLHAAAREERRNALRVRVDAGAERMAEGAHPSYESIGEGVLDGDLRGCGRAG